MTRLIVFGMFLFMLMIHQVHSLESSDKKNVFFELEVRHERLIIFIMNNEENELKINGNFGVGGKASVSPTYLILRDETGYERLVSGVVDDIVTGGAIVLQKSFVYGRSFSLSALKLYFGVGAGKYEIKAVYNDRSTGYSSVGVVESEWIEINFQ